MLFARLASCAGTRLSCWKISFTLRSLNHGKILATWRRRHREKRLCTYRKLYKYRRLAVWKHFYPASSLFTTIDSSPQYTHKTVRQHAIIRTPRTRHSGSTRCSRRRNPHRRHQGPATIPSSSRPTHMRQLRRYHRRKVSLHVSPSTTSQTNPTHPQLPQQHRPNQPLRRHPRCNRRRRHLVCQWQPSLHPVQPKRAHNQRLGSALHRHVRAPDARIRRRLRTPHLLW